MNFPDLKKLFGKKEEEKKIEFENDTEKVLPEDLEKFKVESARPTFKPTAPIEERYGEMPERPLTPITPIGGPTPSALPPAAPATASGDRIDMILQKLETIDTRLKLIEERMK